MTASDLAATLPSDLLWQTDLIISETTGELYERIDPYRPFDCRRNGSVARPSHPPSVGWAGLPDCDTLKMGTALAALLLISAKNFLAEATENYFFSFTFTASIIAVGDPIE
jgi:hypothetical protein